MAHERRETWRVLQGVAFYPRGGSAQVVRYLSRALRGEGHEVHVLSGTLRDGDPLHDARTFYGDLELTSLDYTDAWQAYRQGRDPINAEQDVPFQPSYEDRPGAPDRAFWRVNPAACAALVRSAAEALHRVRARFEPDIIHLHHLNHLHIAAESVFRDVPRATQLHGTEIAMLETLDAAPLHREGSARRSFWREQLGTAAGATAHFFVNSAYARDRGAALLEIDDHRLSTVPNGVDTAIFRPEPLTVPQKLTLLKRILVDDPQGWDESATAGSIRYGEADLRAFSRASGELKPLVIFVGRFLAMKRVPLLLHAVARATRELGATGDDRPPFNLLVWGGSPGEWEGDHPATVARQLGLDNVFFCGWHAHELLWQGLNTADLFVAPSYYEPFGQVYLEAMATGLPVIATRSGGPLSFVVDHGPGANGWLCDVDDLDALTEALCAALSDSGERRRRGDNAVALVRERYAWDAVASAYTSVYNRLLARSRSGT